MTHGVAVISGGGSGIGRAIAVALAFRGHPLALLGRQLRTLDETLALAGGNGRCFELDVRAPEAFDGLEERIATAIGSPEIVVVAAGCARVGKFVDLSADALR